MYIVNYIIEIKLIDYNIYSILHQTSLPLLVIWNCLELNFNTSNLIVNLVIFLKPVRLQRFCPQFRSL